MINYIYVTPNGEILGSGFAQDVKHLSPLDGTQTVLTNGTLPGVDCYYSSAQGKVIEMPKRPGTDYKFNYASKMWELDVTALEVKARAKRDVLLAESDYTQYTDVVLANKAEWATYRQALRDITKQSGFPTNITWPTKPN